MVNKTYMCLASISFSDIVKTIGYHGDRMSDVMPQKLILRYVLHFNDTHKKLHENLFKN